MGPDGLDEAADERRGVGDGEGEDEVGRAGDDLLDVAGDGDVDLVLEGGKVELLLCVCLRSCSSGGGRETYVVFLGEGNKVESPLGNTRWLCEVWLFSLFTGCYPIICILIIGRAVVSSIGKLLVVRPGASWGEMRDRSSGLPAEVPPGLWNCTH